MGREKLEVSDVINHYLPQMDAHSLPNHHLRTLSAISRCRTAALGSHTLKCGTCGAVKVSYNSCRNRHCPKCQGVRKESWIVMQEDMLLPVAYYHVVFTLPHELNRWCMHHPKKMYNLLFKSAWQTLKILAKDPKWIGAQTAATMLLHTWSQTLSLHPHIHCIVPNGGITKEGEWQYPKSGNGNFLFPVKAMQKIYRAIYLKGCKQLLAKGELDIESNKAEKEETLSQIIRKLYKKDWVVFTKKPFSGVKNVIDYLGRYSHRIAITNHRLVDMKDGQVGFIYKDYKDKARKKEMKLSGTEFLRRFCLHILPPHFRKIRQYGFSANACKSKKINQARISLGMQQKELKKRAERKMIAIQRIFDKNNRCPICKNGEMVIVEIIIPNKDPPIQIS